MTGRAGGPCAGCGEPIPDGTEGKVWIDAPLGMTCAWVHRTQECGRAAIERSGGKMRRGNRPPLSKIERLRAEKGDGDGGRIKPDAGGRAGRAPA